MQIHYAFKLEKAIALFDNRLTLFCSRVSIVESPHKMTNCEALKSDSNSISIRTCIQCQRREERWKNAPMNSFLPHQRASKPEPTQNIHFWNIECVKISSLHWHQLGPTSADFAIVDRARLFFSHSFTIIKCLNGSPFLFRWLRGPIRD